MAWKTHGSPALGGSSLPVDGAQTFTAATQTNPVLKWLHFQVHWDATCAPDLPREASSWCQETRNCFLQLPGYPGKPLLAPPDDDLGCCISLL